MVDTTTIIVLATLVQTIVITLTLITFIFQFRSQEKAIKESSYQNLMGRYNDFVMTMIGNPESVKFIIKRASQDRQGGGEVSAQDATMYGNVLVAYGIVEEAFQLYQKGWIDEDTWKQWAAWLKNLSDSPAFGQVRTVTEGTFDPRFEEFVSKFLAGK